MKLQEKINKDTIHSGCEFQTIHESGKTNALLSLINHQPNIDNLFVCQVSIRIEISASHKNA